MAVVGHRETVTINIPAQTNFFAFIENLQRIAIAQAAKRQQKLAPGVSRGFEFHADTSREAAAVASIFCPAGAATSTNIKPQRLRAGLFSRAASRLWELHSVAAARRNKTAVTMAPSPQTLTRARMHARARPATIFLHCEVCPVPGPLAGNCTR